MGYKKLLVRIIEQEQTQQAFIYARGHPWAKRGQCAQNCVIIKYSAI